MRDMIKTLALLYSLSCLFLLPEWASGKENDDTLFIRINPLFRNESLKFNTLYQSDTGDSLTISVFRFYISSIKIQCADKTIYQEKYSYHLINSADEKSLKISIPDIPAKNIAKITFNLGVDSLMSVSGALDGDLDPAKGMYWAWHSGYVNLKLEGESPRCQTRKNEFQFHIGGYQFPNNALRKIELAVNHKKNMLVLNADLSKFFSEVSLSATNNVMIPGTQAIKMADYSTKLFSIE
jgi:hypothetical protein